MIIRRLGLAIGSAALMLSGLTAIPATADNPPVKLPAGYTGCKNGKYWAGGLTGWRTWSACSMTGGRDFYAIATCREGYDRIGPTYPTNGKYTSWTRGGCPTVPRNYTQHIIN